jgi:hypothetical protein
LRTRLRPVNVCCAIVASHFAAPGSGPFRKRGVAFGVECQFVPQPGSPSSGPQILNRDTRFSKNAKRRAARFNAPARQKPHQNGLQSPKLPISQRLAGGPDGASCACRAFVLPPPYGMAIVEIRGVSPPIPTLSRVGRPPDGTRRGLAVASRPPPVRPDPRNRASLVRDSLPRHGRA